MGYGRRVVSGPKTVSAYHSPICSMSHHLVCFVFLKA